MKILYFYSFYNQKLHFNGDLFLSFSLNFKKYISKIFFTFAFCVQNKGNLDECLCIQNCEMQNSVMEKKGLDYFLLI